MAAAIYFSWDIGSHIPYKANKALLHWGNSHKTEVADEGRLLLPTINIF